MPANSGSNISNHTDPGQLGWLTRLAKPWCACVIGVVLTGYATLALWNLERQQSTTELRRQVAIFLGTFSERRIGVDDVLRTLRALISHNPALTRAEFGEVISELALRTRGVQVFIWAAHVPLDQRPRFEKRLRAEGFSDSTIVEGDLTHPNSDRPHIAEPRPEYLAVEYLEPYLGNEASLGYDLLSVPELKKVLERVRTSRGITVSPTLWLPRSDDSAKGVIAATPVLDRRGTNSFLGCVAAVIFIDSFLDSITRRLADLSIDILLTQRGVDGTVDLLHKGSTKPSPSRLDAITMESVLKSPHLEHRFEIGGSTWSFHFRRSPGFDRDLPVSPAALAFWGGLALTLILTRHLALLQSQTQAIATTVRERTSELNLAKSLLEAQIEEVRIAEGLLARERNLLRVLVDHLPDAVFLANSNGTYGMMNQVHARFLGLDRPDMALNQPIAMVGPAALASMLAECSVSIAPQSSEGHELIVPGQANATTGSTSPRVYALFRFPLHQPDDAPQRQLVILRDLTVSREVEMEKKHLQQHLHEAQKLESLGLVTGSIAHDFNTILGIVMGNVELLRIENAENTRILPYLDQIQSGVFRAANLCRQMLTYTGQGRLQLEPLDLSSVVHNTLPLLRISGGGRHHVELVLSSNPLPVLVDVALLTQVLSQLVSNGIEAIGDAAGGIQILTWSTDLDPDLIQQLAPKPTLAPGHYACLEVRDTGTGIDSAILPKIFEPFFTTRFFGRGLGLAAVYGAVRSHKGGIVVNTTLGAGSSFKVFLPLRLDSQPNDQPTVPGNSESLELSS